MNAGSRFTMVLCGLVWVALMLSDLTHSQSRVYPIFEGVIAMIFFAIAIIARPTR